MREIYISFFFIKDNYQLLLIHSKCPKNTSKRPKNPATVNCRWVSSYNPTVANYRWGYFINLLVLLRTSEYHKSNCHSQLRAENTRFTPTKNFLIS